MEKERERLSAQIEDLEQQVQDLKDQNVQLQYKIEYNSEPMLEERLQDAVDMRCVQFYLVYCVAVLALMGVLN